MLDELESDPLQGTTEPPNLNTIVEAYFLTHIPGYEELVELKRKV